MNNDNQHHAWHHVWNDVIVQFQYIILLEHHVCVLLSACAQCICFFLLLINLLLFYIDDCNFLLPRQQIPRFHLSIQLKFRIHIRFWDHSFRFMHFYCSFTFRLACTIVLQAGILYFICGVHLFIYFITFNIENHANSIHLHVLLF